MTVQGRGGGSTVTHIKRGLPEDQPLAQFIHVNITDEEDIKSCVYTLEGKRKDTQDGHDHIGQ